MREPLQMLGGPRVQDAAHRCGPGAAPSADDRHAPARAAVSDCLHEPTDAFLTTALLLVGDLVANSVRNARIEADQPLRLVGARRRDLDLQREDRNSAPKWDFEERQPMPGT